MACLPRMTSWGFSLTAIAWSSLATASGCSSTSVSTRIARSAPIASAVRNVSWQAVTPHDTATISVTMPFSFSRTASSTAISSNGFIDILTLVVSTPEPSGLTRTLTLKSTTRLMGTMTFIFYLLQTPLLLYLNHTAHLSELISQSRGLGSSQGCIGLYLETWRWVQ